MLVLTVDRTRNEPIVIRPRGCKPFLIHVVDFRNDKVRLGFDGQDRDNSYEVNRLVVDKAKHPGDYLPQ